MQEDGEGLGLRKVATPAWGAAEDPYGGGVDCVIGAGARGVARGHSREDFPVKRVEFEKHSPVTKGSAVRFVEMV